MVKYTTLSLAVIRHAKAHRRHKNMFNDVINILYVTESQSESVRNIYKSASILVIAAAIKSNVMGALK